MLSALSGRRPSGSDAERESVGQLGEQEGSRGDNGRSAGISPAYCQLRQEFEEHIAYGWEKALKGELAPKEKAWFRQLADHELAESKLMQEGIPYRKIESWDPVIGLTGKPPNQGAHDLAPPPPKDYPGFEPVYNLF